MGEFDLYCDRCSLPFRPLDLPFKLPQKVQAVLEKGVLTVGKTKYLVSDYDSYGNFTLKKNTRISAINEETGEKRGRLTHRKCQDYFKVIHPALWSDSDVQGQFFDDELYVKSGLFKKQFKFDSAPSVIKGFITEHGEQIKNANIPLISDDYTNKIRKFLKGKKK